MTTTEQPRLEWKSGRQGLFGPIIPRGVFVAAFGNIQYVIRRDSDLRYRVGANAELPTGKQRGFFKTKFPTLDSAKAAAERHLNNVLVAEKEIESVLNREPDPEPNPVAEPAGRAGHSS